MKEAPHEAGPKARNYNSYKQISIGLASPQYALAEPVTQHVLAFGECLRRLVEPDRRGYSKPVDEKQIKTRIKKVRSADPVPASETVDVDTEAAVEEPSSRRSKAIEDFAFKADFSGDPAP